MSQHRRPSALWYVSALLGTLVALGAWGFTFVASAFACHMDTSECADSHAPREFRGRLFDYEGRPAADTRLLFSSGLYRHRGSQQVLTDEAGRFCVRALEGRTSSFITVDGQKYGWQLVVKSDAPVDPRLADPGVREQLRHRRAEDTGVDRMGFMIVEPASFETTTRYPSIFPLASHDAVELWNAATDAAPVCQTVAESPAWNRFTGMRRSWQFVLLNLLPIATIVLFLVGIRRIWTASRTRSDDAVRRADQVMQATCVAAATTIVLTYALWALA